MHPDRTPSYDLVVIGAGHAAASAALRAQERGWRTAWLGPGVGAGDPPGVSLTRACDLAAAAAHPGDAASPPGPGPVWASWPRPVQSADPAVSELVRALVAGGTALCAGRPVLGGAGRVRVEPDGPELTAKAILLASDSRPAGLPGATLDGHLVLTPAELLNAPSAPDSVLVAGGGAIAVGVGGLLAACGTTVTLATRADRLVPRLDPEVSAGVRAALEARGVQVHVRSRLREIRPAGDHVAAVVDDRAAGTRPAIEAERLVVATGWRPGTAGLGLEHTRAVLDKRGHVQVDSSMATAEPGLYAVGGVVPTHDGEGFAAAEIAAALEHMAGAEPRPARTRRFAHRLAGIIPAFGLGLAEPEARAMGHLVRCGTAHTSSGGWLKVVADTESGRVLGVHALGPGVTGFLDLAVMAVAGPAWSPETAAAAGSPGGSNADEALAVALAAALGVKQGETA